MRDLSQQEMDFPELYEESELSVLPPENIVVLNELRSAADLNRLMKDDESIDIKPDFQREEVWNDNAKVRFVDSLSKEFPIPSMCFALDPKRQKYIVIDGRQRMSTILKFLSDDDWRMPKLDDVDAKISGATVSELRSKYPEIYRKIENMSLPVTILRYDPTRKDNMEYIYTIFQRLNSLGERLNNQEIRNAIFQGPFNSFIKSCAKNDNWDRFIRDHARTKSPRMLSEESLLRFFAFYDELELYTGKLNTYLNGYMLKHRMEGDNEARQALFDSVMDVVSRIDASRVNKSNALRDAFLYGVSKNIESLRDASSSRIKELLATLEEDPHFSVSELSGGIMMKRKVIDRLNTAKRVFAAGA